jgi:fluoride exporter
MMIILNKRVHFKELFVIYANLNYQILTTADQGCLAGRYDSVRHLPIAVAAAIHFMSAVAILRPMTAFQALQKCSRAFAANVVGGFAMGLLAGWLARFNTSAGEPIRLLLAVGLLGGFTTFSSFSLETVLMMERGQMGVALGYVVLSVIGAVGALAGGLAFMRSIA